MLCSLVCTQAFVRVQDGRFSRDGKPYYFIGTNFWYGPILGSEGEGGDRGRLCRELDSLCAIGINNLRILVGADKGSVNANSVAPYLQNDDGTLNDDLLAGLDYLMSEMQKRNMLAVLYLTNSWDWSGGFGSYLRRVGKADSPASSGEGYNDYVRYAAEFSVNKKAQALYLSFIEKIITRTNRYTGKKYVEDPSIMSWQICNEPRPFGKTDAIKKGFTLWIKETAAKIKALDPNHLVSLGTEGLYGCESDEELCTHLHLDANVDYLTVHIWPCNWQWANRDRLYEDLPHTYVKTKWYIDLHNRMARKIRKPFVIEEFGYPRDSYSFSVSASTDCRNAFYQYIMNFVIDSSKSKGMLAGCNFWGWGGEAVPVHKEWEKGDPFMCDPPHEPQGWYSVYQSDTSTVRMVEQNIRRLKSK